MSRTTRDVPGGLVHHVLNRANARTDILSTDADCGTFERVLAEVVEWPRERNLTPLSFQRVLFEWES